MIVNRPTLFINSTRQLDDIRINHNDIIERSLIVAGSLEVYYSLRLTPPDRLKCYADYLETTDRQGVALKVRATLNSWFLPIKEGLDYRLSVCRSVSPITCWI